jgi:hypothetical protein
MGRWAFGGAVEFNIDSKDFDSNLEEMLTKLPQIIDRYLKENAGKLARLGVVTSCIYYHSLQETILLNQAGAFLEKMQVVD